MVDWREEAKRYQEERDHHVPDHNDRRPDEEQRRRIMDAVNKVNEGKTVGCDGETSRYDQALNEIIKGAEKLKAVASDDNVLYNDDVGGFGSRVSNGAFVLRMAHQIWTDVYHREEQEKHERQMREQMKAQGGMVLPGGPPAQYLSGMAQLGLGGGKMMGLHTLNKMKSVRRRQTVPPDILEDAAVGGDAEAFAQRTATDTLTECLKLCAEAGVTPDQVGKIGAAYGDYYASLQKEQQVEGQAKAKPAALDRSET
jgi:hypothetical protein